MYYLGLDIGTTHIKTCLINDRNEVLHVTIDDNKLQNGDFSPSYDPEQLWRAVLENMRIALYDIDVSKLKGIGVTSMAEAGLPIDAEGKPIYPIIPWQDMRGAHYVDLFVAKFGAFSLYKKTGLVYHPKCSLFKIMAFRDEYPEAFNKMKAWLSVADWIIYKLSGSMVMDESQACRTGLFNISTRAWDDELIKAAELADKLPDVVGMGSVVGTIRPELISSFGFDPHVKIVSAGHDHLSAAIAVGAPENDYLLNSMGTSEVYIGFIDQPILRQSVFEACLNQGCMADGRYYWMANMPASGASVEWMRKILSTEGEVKYNLFDRESHLTDPSPVLYFPYLNGSGTPHTDFDQRAMFLGISSDTSVYQMIKGIYEGIGFESRWILDSLAQLGFASDKIVAVGGGTKNESLLKTKADVIGKPITLTSLDEAAGIGAALQAAKACRKADPSLEGRDEPIQQTWRQVLPKKSLQGHYEKRYRTYRNVYFALLPLKREIIK